jgi:hypothetical protein
VKRNWEVQLSPPAVRAALREVIAGTGSLAREFAPVSKLEALLDEFATRPTAASGYTVSMLLTFCAWGRHFANHEA